MRQQMSGSSIPMIIRTQPPRAAWVSIYNAEAPLEALRSSHHGQRTSCCRPEDPLHCAGRRRATRKNAPFVDAILQHVTSHAVAARSYIETIKITAATATATTLA